MSVPPIIVSSPGVSTGQAAGVSRVMNTKYPFAKLDSTKDESFEIIDLTFNSDTPNPNGTSQTYLRTLVYSFPHGYKYLPATWFLVSTNSFVTSIGSEGVIMVGSGTGILVQQAVLIVRVDEANVYFYVDKYYDSVHPTTGAVVPSVAGLTVSIRSFIFVNDLTGTDIPDQA